MQRMQRGNFPALIRLQNPAQAVEGIEDAFTWSAEISSDRMDAYYTHMAESTLRNFATDAATGITFLDSHNARNLGYGQSIGGSFQIENGVSRVVGDFYTVPGLRFGSALTYQSTDDFIRAIQARLVRDVSVGFYGGDMICDICGSSFYDFRSCTHWPGQGYTIGEGQKAIATFAIENANLAEVSAVYDGATPGAMVLRATEMNEAGLLAPEIARRLETQYRIKLPDPPKLWRGVSTEGKKVMDENTKSRLIGLGIEHDDPQEIITDLLDQIGRMAMLADQGRAYRQDLIDTALGEGIKAMGNDFPAETYREMFSSAPLDTVKLLRDRWQEQAGKMFTGGRLTVDAEQKQTARSNGPAIPEMAFKS